MNITPVFKKGEKESENNYRSVSILSNVLKVFEKCTFRHISDYMEYYLSKYQCGLEKVIAHKFVFCACLTNGNKQWKMKGIWIIP